MSEKIKAIRVMAGSVLEEKTVRVIEIKNEISDIFEQFDYRDNILLSGDIWHIRNKNFMVFYKPYIFRYGKSISNFFYAEDYLDEKDIIGDAIIVNTNDENEIIGLRESDIELIKNYPALTFRFDGEEFIVKYFVSGYFVENRVCYQRYESDGETTITRIH